MAESALPSRRKKRVLVAYSASGTHVQTTLDYLMSLSRYLNAEVNFVHVTNDAVLDFDLNAYDAVFHNYCARWPFEGHVSATYTAALVAFRGPKILAVQDEYDRTNNLKEAILRHGFNVVLTCIPPDQIERVYEPARFSHVEFVTVLTGYVPEGIESLGQYAMPLRQRPILIGHRGRDIGGKYGQLGFDKLEIGRRMREICEQRGLPVDIDWTEDSRIYGTDWFRFLGSCRATLGVESGSNVFDFDGSIEQRFAAETARLGRRPTFEEFLPTVRAEDAAMDIGQISPRVFEAATLRTPMVHFTGRYSDIIKPGEHYIELKKDFSNVDDVLRSLEDFPALEAMVERAHAKLIASGAYGYPPFVAMLDALIDRKLAEAPAQPKAMADGAAPAAPKLSDGERRLLTEEPTKAPLPAHHLHLKLVRREALIYQAEIRLLNEVHTAEVDRLQEVYTAEIDRLQARIQHSSNPPYLLRALISRTPIVGGLARALNKGWRALKTRA